MQDLLAALIYGVSLLDSGHTKMYNATYKIAQKHAMPAMQPKLKKTDTEKPHHKKGMYSG